MQDAGALAAPSAALMAPCRRHYFHADIRQARLLPMLMICRYAAMLLRENTLQAP